MRAWPPLRTIIKQGVTAHSADFTIIGRIITAWAMRMPCMLWILIRGDLCGELRQLRSRKFAVPRVQIAKTCLMVAVTHITLPGSVRQHSQSPEKGNPITPLNLRMARPTLRVEVRKGEKANPTALSLTRRVQAVSHKGAGKVRTGLTLKETRFVISVEKRRTSTSGYLAKAMFGVDWGADLLRPVMPSLPPPNSIMPVQVQLGAPPAVA